MAHQTVCILLTEGDRERLEAIVGDRNRPLKHVQRAQIILASDRQPRVLNVAEAVGCSPGGLALAATRKPPTSPDLVAKVVEMTCQEPPHEVTHRIGRAMAEAVGLSLRTIQRIWEA